MPDSLPAYLLPVLALSFTISLLIVALSLWSQYRSRQLQRKLLYNRLQRLTRRTETAQALPTFNPDMPLQDLLPLGSQTPPRWPSTSSGPSRSETGIPTGNATSTDRAGRQRRTVD